MCGPSASSVKFLSVFRPARPAAVTFAIDAASTTMALNTLGSPALGEAKTRPSPASFDDDDWKYAGRSGPLAFACNSPKRDSSPTISPAGTECFDIFSPPPGLSEVTSQG